MSTFPVTPEFVYTLTENYSTIQTPFESGHVQIRARWQRPRRHFRCVWKNATLAERDDIIAFFKEHKGPATSFIFSVPDMVAPPWAAPSLAEYASGSLSADTYYVAFTWGDGTNETTISAEGSIAIGASKGIDVTIPLFPSGVDRARIYIGIATGVLYYQGNETESGGTYTQTSALQTAVSPPSANTLEETATVHLLGDAVTFHKVSPVSYSAELVFEELFT